MSTTGSVFGMAEDRAVAARRRGARAGVDVLLVLAAGRAQVHVRVDEGREGGAGPRPSTTSAPVGRLERPGSPTRRSRPPRTRTSPGAVEPARGSSSRAPRDQHGPAPARRGRAPGRAALGAHAGWGSVVSPSGLPAGASAPLAAAGQQLVQDGHAHHDAGLDLLGDQRLRRVDHLGRSSTPRLTGPGCISSWPRAQPAAVDLVVGGVLAQRGHERARPCARSASAARRSTSASPRSSSV